MVRLAADMSCACFCNVELFSLFYWYFKCVLFHSIVQGEVHVFSSILLYRVKYMCSLVLLYRVKYMCSLVLSYRVKYMCSLLFYRTG